MKFVCDGCGKKYATSEDPSPGRVYKLKCKACGHLIVVKAQAGTSTALPALTPTEQVSAVPSTAAPELEIDVEPEPSRTPPPAPRLPDVTPGPLDGAAMAEPSPLPPEVASAVDGALPPPPEKDALPPPPPPEKDELADFAAAAAEVMAAPAPGAGRAGYVDLFGDGITGEHKLKAEPSDHDPRAPAPEGTAGAAPPPASAAAPAAPSAPPRPGPRATSKAASPLLFVGLGVVLIGGITATAILTGGKKAEPPPAVAAPAPAPSAPPVVVTPPPAAVAAPAVAEKKPEPAPVVERKPEPRPEPPRPRPAPVEKKPEPKPEPRPAPAPPPPPEVRTETRDVQLPDAESALTPEVVQKVINANRKAFANCIAAAGSDVKMDGRKVALKLTVNTNGAVTYPTLDDVTLNSTEMGQCLKSAARLMIFPKFKGDPFHVEVPLTLSN